MIERSGLCHFKALNLLFVNTVLSVACSDCYNPGQKHRGLFATGVTIDNNIAIDFFVNNHRFCDNQALIDTPSIIVAHRHVAIHL